MSSEIMSDLINQGLLGIVTGVLTTAILFTGKIFWSTKVTPFLVGLRYQGVEIDGHWAGVDELTADRAQAEQAAQEAQEVEVPKEPIVQYRSEHSLFLLQNAQKLTGSFQFKYKSSEKEFTLDFNVDGYLWEGYVTLNLTPRDKKVTSYATCMLKLHDGGLSLLGQWLFRDVVKEYVSGTTLNLFRSPPTE